jgi:hypothetical protein
LGSWAWHDLFVEMRLRYQNDCNFSYIGPLTLPILILSRERDF